MFCEKVTARRQSDAGAMIPAHAVDSQREGFFGGHAF
jgi:hypothetical protein